MSQHPYVASATTENERFKRLDQMRYAAMRFRVWHIPQVPGKPFYVQCNSIDTAIGVTELLGQYDLFQLANRIKPDYANANGIQYYDHEVEEWFEFEMNDELEDYREAMMSPAVMGLEGVEPTPIPGWKLEPGQAVYVEDWGTDG